MDEMRIQGGFRPPLPAGTALKKTDDTETRGFGDFLSDSLEKASRQIKAADGQAQRMTAGEDVSIHETMIGLEKANISLQFMMQVRNKVMEAYQQIMRMQI